jgi:hypothetical protein
MRGEEKIISGQERGREKESEREGQSLVRQS